MRESVQAKALRYLSERRLTITYVADDGVMAVCRGGDALYEISYQPEFRVWRCSCPARAGCAHLEATRMVVIR